MNNDPSYLEQLSDAVLEKLEIFKRERGVEDYLEADMWCQFGRATIRGPDEGTMHFSGGDVAAVVRSHMSGSIPLE